MAGTNFFDDDLQRRGVGRTATDVVGTAKMEDLQARPLSDLNLTRMARQREEINSQVTNAKVGIDRLQRHQSDLEREKQALEDLLEKQDQYEQGKQEMMQRLSESVVSLEKLEDHASRQLEIYASARSRFAECVEEIRRINDSNWSDDSFREELNKAVVQIDAIRKEFVKGQAAVEAVGGPAKLFDESRPRIAFDDEPESAKGFSHWFKIGVAVSIPLIVAIAIAVLILVLAR